MQETLALVDTLKRILRSKGITYQQLAEQLDLSEASVKRVFSDGSFSLARFEKICQIAEVTMAEVNELSQAGRKPTSHTYTLQQEKYFAENPKYLAFFDLLIRFGTLKKVREYKPNLTDARVSKYLKQLESMGLIERHPNDRVSFPVSRSVNWQKNGPLGRKLRNMAKADFIDGKFSGDLCTWDLMGIELTEKSAAQVAERLQELADDIRRIGEMEQKLKANTQLIGVMLAQRPWQFSLLEDC